MKRSHILLNFLLCLGFFCSFANDETQSSKQSYQPRNYGSFISYMAKETSGALEKYEKGIKKGKDVSEESKNYLENLFKRAFFATIYAKDIDFQSGDKRTLSTFKISDTPTLVDDSRMLAIYEICKNLAKYVGYSSNYYGLKMNEFLNLSLEGIIASETGLGRGRGKARQVRSFEYSDTEWNFSQRLMLTRITLIYYAKFNGIDNVKDIYDSFYNHLTSFYRLPKKRKEAESYNNEAIYRVYWVNTQTPAEMIQSYLQSNLAKPTVALKTLKKVDKIQVIPDEQEEEKSELAIINLEDVLNAFRDFSTYDGNEGINFSVVESIANQNILKYPFKYYNEIHSRKYGSIPFGQVFLKSLARANVVGISEDAKNQLEALQRAKARASKGRQSSAMEPGDLSYVFDSSLNLEDISEKDAAEIFLPKDLKDFIEIDGPVSLESLYKDPQVFDKLTELPIIYLTTLAKRHVGAYEELETRVRSLNNNAFELFLRLEGLTLDDIKKMATAYEEQYRFIDEDISKDPNFFKSIIRITDISQDDKYENAFIRKELFDVQHFMEILIKFFSADLNQSAQKYFWQDKKNVAELLLNWMEKSTALRELIITTFIKEMMPEPTVTSFNRIYFNQKTTEPVSPLYNIYNSKGIFPESENSPEKRFNNLLKDNLKNLINEQQTKSQQRLQNESLKNKIVPQMLQILSEYFEQELKRRGG